MSRHEARRPGQRTHWSREDDEIGAGQNFRSGGSPVDAASLQRNVEIGLGTAHANHLVGQPFATGNQAERASEEPDPDDPKATKGLHPPAPLSRGG